MYIFCFRFASFIEGESHLSEEEVCEFEDEPARLPSTLETDDESDGDAAYLSSPSNVH